MCALALSLAHLVKLKTRGEEERAREREEKRRMQTGERGEEDG